MLRSELVHYCSAEVGGPEEQRLVLSLGVVEVCASLSSLQKPEEPPVRSPWDTAVF